MSSRAVIHKGRLRHDDAGRRRGPRRDDRRRGRSPAPRCARVDRRSRVRARRARRVRRAVLDRTRRARRCCSSCGDIATRAATLELHARDATRSPRSIVLDREALAAGRTARAIARVQLTVAGAPASLALLERPTWDVTLTDRARRRDDEVAAARARRRRRRGPRVADGRGHRARRARRARRRRGPQRAARAGARRSSAAFEVAHDPPRRSAIEALYLARTASGLGDLGARQDRRAARAAAGDGRPRPSLGADAAQRRARDRRARPRRARRAAGHRADHRDARRPPRRAGSIEDHLGNARRCRPRAAGTWSCRSPPSRTAAEVLRRAVARRDAAAPRCATRRSRSSRSSARS